MLMLPRHPVSYLVKPYIYYTDIPNVDPEQDRCNSNKSALIGERSFLQHVCKNFASAAHQNSRTILLPTTMIRALSDSLRDRIADGGTHFQYHQTGEEGHRFLNHTSLRPPSGNASNILSLEVLATDPVRCPWTAGLYQHKQGTCPVKGGDRELIAVCTFYVMPRRVNGGFHGACDVFCDETVEVGCSYFTDTGFTKRWNAPNMRKDDSYVSWWTGLVIHIESVEVNPEYQGRKYGLHVIDQILELFSPLWGVCVLVPAPLNLRQWENSIPHPGEAHRSKEKLGEYYSRMGFSYFRKKRDCDPTAMYLCSSTWEEIDSSCYDLPPNPSRNKLFHQPLLQYSQEQLTWQKRVSLALVDKGVRAAVEEIGRILREVPDTLPVLRAGFVQNLIKQPYVFREPQSNGDTVQTGSTSHVSEEQIMDLIKCLSVYPGYDISASDALGYTVLHCCVEEGHAPFNLFNVAMSYGADATARTYIAKATALDFALQKAGIHCDSNSKCDYYKEVIEPLIRADPNAQNRANTLIDGWMTLEMCHALIFAAELRHDMSREYVSDVQGPTTSREEAFSVLGGNIPMDHIPSEVPMEYFHGYTSMFDAVLAVLKSGHAPTVSLTRQAAYRHNRASAHAFESGGGRVEHIFAELMRILHEVYDNWEEKLLDEEEEETDIYPALPDDSFNNLGFVALMVFRGTRFIPMFRGYPGILVGEQSFRGYYAVTPIDE